MITAELNYWLQTKKKSKKQWWYSTWYTNCTDSL